MKRLLERYWWLLVAALVVLGWVSGVLPLPV